MIKKCFFLLILSVIMSVLFFIRYKFEWKISTFDEWSEYLVANSIYKSIDRGIFFEGGYMAEVGRPGIEKLHRKDFNAETYSVYDRQFGLQYKMFSIFAPSDKNLFLRYYYLLKIVTVFMLACVLNILVYAVKKEFGFVSAVTLFLLLIASDSIVFYSFNLYWVAYTLFLPFAMAWLLLPNIIERNRYLPFYALIAFLVMIKALCGLEFITNVAASPIIPLIYYELKRNTAVSVLFKKMAGIAVSGMIGVAIAVMITLVQGFFYFGSFSKAIEPIVKKILIRTLGDAGSNELVVQFDIYDTVRTFVMFLKKAMFFDHIPIFIILAAGVLFLIMCRSVLKAMRKPRGINDTVPARTIYALSMAVLASFAVSFSWFAVAFGHTRYHDLHCTILMFLPLFCMLFASVPFVLKTFYCCLIKKRLN